MTTAAPQGPALPQATAARPAPAPHGDDRACR